MPCDSAAAGLIALGAMIRDLANPRANVIDGHYDALLRHARQYLGSCRDCGVEPCDPAFKRCGHLREAQGKLRSPLRRGIVTVSDRTDIKEGKLAWEYRAGGKQKGTGTQWPTPEYAVNWHVDGEPPSQSPASDGVLSEGLYGEIVPGTDIIADNLRRSYSGLCLAGRAAGETVSRNICESIRLLIGEEEHGLADMLTVHGWSKKGTVSRVSFFNTRTGALDRHSTVPSLVIADGDIAFLKINGRDEFQHSDIVGVISRVTDRDSLEAIGNKMLGLRQWYEPNSDLFERFPQAPRGISVSILRRRA
jgi:hypothetical protein